MMKILLRTYESDDYYPADCCYVVLILSQQGAEELIRHRLRMRDFGDRLAYLEFWDNGAYEAYQDLDDVDGITDDMMQSVNEGDPVVLPDSVAINAKPSQIGCATLKVSREGIHCDFRPEHAEVSCETPEVSFEIISKIANPEVTGD